MANSIRRLNLSPVFLIEIGLVCVVLVCIIIVFTGNGLKVEDVGYKIQKRKGLWYETKCTEDSGCTSKSLKNMYDDGETDEVDYYSKDVFWQIIVTLSLFCSGLIGLLYFLSFFKVIKLIKIRPFILVLCIIIGGFLLVISGYEGVRQATWHLHERLVLHFPWTLFFLAAAGVFAVVLGALNFFTVECSRGRLDVNAVDIWKRLPFLIEFSLMMISFIFQLAIHGGDGMLIVERKFYNLDSVTRNVTENVYNHIEERYGVWYVTFCNGTECKLMSRREHNILSNSGNDYLIDVTKGIYTGFMTIMTIILVSTLVAVILYGIGLCRRSGKFTCHIRIYILTCTMIAGVMGLDMCASDAIWQHLISKISTDTYVFPWGLLLLGISAVLDMIVAGINLFIISYKDYGSIYEQTQHVQSLNMS